MGMEFDPNIKIFEYYDENGFLIDIYSYQEWIEKFNEEPKLIELVKNAY